MTTDAEILRNAASMFRSWMKLPSKSALELNRRAFVTAADLVDRCIARNKLGPAVAVRMRKLNTGVAEEGIHLRGFRPAPTAHGRYGSGFNMDITTRAKFNARWGKGASRTLTKEDRISGGGRRRWITGMAFEQGPRISNQEHS